MIGATAGDGLAHDKRMCLFAAVEVTNLRNGGSFEIDSFPDDVERTLPAVDLIGHDDNGSIVVEHTVVESYDFQLHDNKRLFEVFAGFADRVRRSLDHPGAYTLAVQTMGGHLFPRRGEAAVLNEIEAWVRRQRLPVPQIPPRSPNHVKAGPPEVVVPLTLYRMSCQADDDGTLRVVFARPQDLEERRERSIARALETKLPKLLAEQLPGGVTLLVLETRDYVLSNPWTLAATVRRVAGDRQELPDYVICVDSSPGAGHWIAYRVKTPEGWSDAANSRSHGGMRPLMTAPRLRSDL